MTNPLRALCILLFAAIITGAAFADGFSTPLHEAAKDGDVHEVERLIDSGANVNAKDKHGWTPLHVAVVRFNVRSALALLEAGADFMPMLLYIVSLLFIILGIIPFVVSLVWLYDSGIMRENVVFRTAGIYGILLLGFGFVLIGFAVLLSR